MEIRSDSCVEEINGEWFVCVDASSIDVAIVYDGYGELPDGIHGPFESEDDAVAWLVDYDKGT